MAASPAIVGFAVLAFLGPISLFIGLAVLVRRRRAARAAQAAIPLTIPADVDSEWHVALSQKSSLNAGSPLPIKDYPLSVTFGSRSSSSRIAAGLLTASSSGSGSGASSSSGRSSSGDLVGSELVGPPSSTLPSPAAGEVPAPASLAAAGSDAVSQQCQMATDDDTTPAADQQGVASVTQQHAATKQLQPKQQHLCEQQEAGEPHQAAAAAAAAGRRRSGSCLDEWRHAPPQEHCVVVIPSGSQRTGKAQPAGTDGAGAVRLAQPQPACVA